MGVRYVSHSGYSGVWLLLQHTASLDLALPVPRQASLGQTRAVLAQPDAIGCADVLLSAELSSRIWLFAGDDPAVAAWLAQYESTVKLVVGLLPSESQSPAAVHTRDGLLGRHLAESIVIPGSTPFGERVLFLQGAAWDALATPPSGASQQPRSLSAVVLADRCERGDVLLAHLKAHPWRPSSAALLARNGNAILGKTEGVPSLESLVLRDAIAMALSMNKQTVAFEQAVAEARLESMRELAYGAGHEINNPLANIATRAQALLLDEKDSERRRRLATIVDQSFRARDMIGGLMLFARPPKSQPAATDVGSIMLALVDSIAPLVASRHARLEYSPPPVPIEVVVDRSQIEEALRAIAVNALEAIADGGRVVLAACHRISGGEARCVVSVTDEGRGMDAETKRRAFDPFFSGREAGRGAGLGLSKAWRLIEASGGTVTLASKLGHGTQVSIMLPLGAGLAAEGIVANGQTSVVAGPEIAR